MTTHSNGASELSSNLKLDTNMQKTEKCHYNPGVLNFWQIFLLLRGMDAVGLIDFLLKIGGKIARIA